MCEWRVGTHGEQKKKLEPLEFELQVVGNCPWLVGARNPALSQGQCAFNPLCFLYLEGKICLAFSRLSRNFGLTNKNK